MQPQDMIPEEDFCSNYDVEIAFVHSLKENGLIEIVTLEEKRFIPVGQLQELEKLMRLHYDLEINLEGIEAIGHLIHRVKCLQEDLTNMKNKLRLYEKE